MRIFVALSVLLFVGADCWAAPISLSQLEDAIVSSGLATVQRYIAGGGDLEARDKNDWTPLLLATLYGRTTIAMVLLDAGANPAARQRDNGSVLDVAVFDDETGILVAQLIDQGFLPKARDQARELLGNALNFGMLEVCKVLITAGVEMDDSLWGEARTEGNKSSYGFDSRPFVTELQAFLADVDRYSPLLKEWYSYDFNATLQEVIRRIAEADPADAYPRVSGSVVDILVSQVLADPMAQPTSPLLFALRYQDAKTIKLLLEAGESPNSRDGQGWSALALAAFLGNEDIVRQLIESGGDAALAKEILEEKLRESPHDRGLSSFEEGRMLLDRVLE